jgi:hypothetical protein
MSRARASFKQGDLDRAIRVAKKHGLVNYEVVVEGGRVTLRVSDIDKSKPDTTSSWHDAIAELEVNEQSSSPVRASLR